MTINNDANDIQWLRLVKGETKMSYIFISYSKNLEEGSNSNNDFYNLSLKDQYKLIQKRIPLERQVSSFETFIEACFPSGLRKKYYISCPNFLREKHQSREGKPTFLNNVVLRPELTLSMKRYLPNNQNVILIGDIYEGGKLKMLQIKGIQLIDSSMSSPNDMIANEPVCNSFKKNIWSIANVDYNDTFFTPNKVLELIETCYTVKNPEKIRETYEERNKYIEFRNYYLKEQSKRNFKLDRALFIRAYAINKKEYKKNSTIYDDYLLDGLKEFTRGDMVCLNSQVEDAEEFPLIRLDIERNKNSFEEAKVLKKGKLINEEERKIRSLASDNVFITSKDPTAQSKSKDKYGNNQSVTFSELINSGYVLGDRFKIVQYEILPDEHLCQLDDEYNYDIEKSYKKIEEQFDEIINSEIDKALKNYKTKLEEDYKIVYNSKKIELHSLYLGDEALDLLKNSITDKVIHSTKKEKDEIEEYYQKRLNKLIDFNINKEKEKNNEKFLNKLNQYKKNLINKYEKEVSKYKNEKQIEISNKYKEDIRNEKIQIKTELDEKLKTNKDKTIEEETIIRFSLYFRLGDANNAISDKQINIISDCKYIVYDNRAEKAKIARQEQALNNFYSGYTKNPYLSTYLFDPQELNSIAVEPSDWNWFLESLNEKQKEAVRKAVSSNGIFLLQGPPGTGKTQVIAEIVAQLVKKGKKILISSETHKAIDNVFERLPKIAEIIPIRLIPSNNSKKDNNYDPKFLVDNFYTNISSNMEKSIERYKNFRKNKIEFSETYNRLKLLKKKIDKSTNILDKAYAEIKILDDKTKSYTKKINILEDETESFRVQLDILRRTKRYIENDNFSISEDVRTDIIANYKNDLAQFYDKTIYSDIKLGDLVRNIISIKPEDIQREIITINPESKRTLLELKKEELRIEISKYVDEVGDLKDEKYKEVRNEKKSELREVINKLNNNSLDSDSSLKLKEIFNYSYLVSNASSISNLVMNAKDFILKLKAQYVETIDKESSNYEEKLNNIDKQIKEQKHEIKLINDSIIDIREQNDIQEIQKNKYKLENELILFFKSFEIFEPFNDIDEALSIIEEKWHELEIDFDSKEEENKEKIPMYEKISNYINSKDVIESDRKNFTKDLFENANVFGITCTSNDRFSGKNIDAFSEYNIDNIDIKSVGIDVVIIDEVSKSSFIDLLIPILYGKTVILVGDHRQLPPMYEFAKLRNDDFEGLDENIINPSINKSFTKLYEECFFKTLFEKIPESYKTMLVQQYRCHEHIMNVFNHFYQNELKLGWSGQNNNKRHNISLFSNGRNIIEPDKHIYFVDCKQNETHEMDSTSMYNTGEAKVVVEFIRKLNNYFKKNPEREKLSIGVICTYGDQARKIKDILKSEKVKTDAFKTNNEKMIVSTVDDFQGDERDIIILSTVRNPEDPNRSNPGFILAYQRINVALSRARRMLIMVGNRKYLETKGVINLPDVHGRLEYEKRNFRVYEEIIATIEKYGKVIDDLDVLEDKEEKLNG